MHNIPDVPLTTAWQLLERLHDKLKTMKGALQGHVYDVISDLLTLNGIDFERLIKDTLLNPGRIEAAKQPEYVEAYFLDAAERVRLWVERRADTLLRIEHVPRGIAVNRDLRRPRDDAAVIHSPVQATKWPVRTSGNPEPVFAEVVAVVEDQGQLHRAPVDVLHTLTPATGL